MTSSGRGKMERYNAEIQDRHTLYNARREGYCGLTGADANAVLRAGHAAQWYEDNAYTGVDWLQDVALAALTKPVSEAVEDLATNLQREQNVKRLLGDARRLDRVSAIPDCLNTPPRFKHDSAASVLDDSVLALLSRLGDEDRRIMQLYWVDCKSERDIASLVGMTQSAVSKRLAYCVPKLRWWSQLPPAPPNQYLRSMLTPLQYKIVKEYCKDYSQIRAAERLTARGHRTRQSTVHVLLRKAKKRLTDPAAKAWMEYIISAVGVTNIRGRNAFRGMKRPRREPGPSVT